MTNTISCQNTVESSGPTCRTSCDESSGFRSETSTAPKKVKHGKWCPPARPLNHMNYMYKTVDDVKYERFAPGKVIKIAGPGSKPRPLEVASEQLLKTKMLDKPGTDRLIGRICLHYVEAGQCFRGAQCTYAHPVLIHPDAEYDARGKPRKGLLMKDNCDEFLRKQVEKKSLSPEQTAPQQQKSKPSLVPISDYLSPPPPVPVPATVSTVPLVMLQPVPMMAHPGGGPVCPNTPLPLPSVSMPMPMDPPQYSE